ncbi:MAG: thiol:disulfide interchange protein, partial [Bacteroidaceae bacterium]|nr:thiol:disulfide interchange protein [Bacteroidaceae bacterium]
MMKRLFFSMLLALFASAVNAQVKFSVEQKHIAVDQFELVFTGTIESGWHIYSTTEANGPIPTTFNVDKKSGCEPIGNLVANKKAVSHFEEAFDATVTYYEGSVTLTQKIKITGEAYSIEGFLEYGACNDHNCLPPTSVDFKYEGKGVSASAAKAVEPKAEETKSIEEPTVAEPELTAQDSVATQPAPTIDQNVWWTPVIDELAQFGEHADTANRSL